MKSIISLIILSLLFISCAKEEDSDDGVSALSDSEMASFAGTGASMSQSMSDLAIGFDSTPPSLAKILNSESRQITSNPRSANSSLTEYTYDSGTGYWQLSQTVSTSGDSGSFSYDYSMNIGLWESNSLTQTITTALEQVTMYGTMAFTISNSQTGQSVVVTMTVGSANSPFRWSGINGTTVTMDGTFSFNISSAGQSASMDMTLSSMEIDQTGSNTYPSGTMTISGSSGSASFEGTIVYDGDSTAVATVNGTSVDVNLASTALVE